MARGKSQGQTGCWPPEEEGSKSATVVQAAVMMKSKSEMRKGDRREVYRRGMGGTNSHSEKPRVRWGWVAVGTGFSSKAKKPSQSQKWRRLLKEGQVQETMFSVQKQKPRHHLVSIGNMVASTHHRIK